MNKDLVNITSDWNTKIRGVEHYAFNVNQIPKGVTLNLGSEILLNGKHAKIISAGYFTAKILDGNPPRPYVDITVEFL